MTDSDSDDQQNGAPSGSSRGQRRAAARAKAQAARQRQKARARRGRWAIQGALGLVIIAVIVGIVLVVTQSVRPEGPGPANMAGDGITIGRDFKAVPADAQSASAAPSPTTTAAAADTVKISVYLDYLCPICGSFGATNNEYIKGLVESGAATVDYHPIAILTNQSLGTKYSQRAANAAACVATYSPDAFFDFNTAMFAKQPKEGTAGLTDAAILTLIKGVPKITQTDSIARCISDKTYVPWVVSATQRALDGPIAGSSIGKVQGTPTVLVNGQEYKATTPFTTAEFSNFVVTAAGNSYSDTATSSATPTPTKK
ncbi:Serine/threonine-protein kinase PknE [Frondihabitans sp. 762G35]|uniref:DsbA family protein n=1 Tax=Frondihabitans sp. 762G35 TaxID=1446794 RepID=UPI000D212646|nr:thioredoxin domain-containing protein [Frondihabitans sp. 762G35]ARC55917.1 Serine/threonine-protein kinase PknE [Frondihabitans sp. 762G35]